MKKILALVVSIGIILSGCGIESDISDKMKSPSYPQSETTVGIGEESKNIVSGEGQKNQIESQRIFDNFIKLVEDGKTPQELIVYIDREIGNVRTDKADEILLALEEVQLIYESYYQEEILDIKYSKDIYDAAKKGMETDIVDRVKNEELKSLLREVFNGGYKLVSKEGSFYPVVDYKFLKKYEQYVSTQVKDYIGIMAVESEKSSTEDGALMISWNELAQRLLKIESYIENYNNSPRIGKVEEMYYHNMMTYLMGLPNTLAYDYQTKVYKDDVLKSFNDLISNNKNSKSAEIVKQYLEIIEKNQFIFNTEAKEFTKKIYLKNNSPYSNSTNYKYINGILTRLLPEKSGYKWIYQGFAEYGHNMTLQEIIKDDDVMKYIIKGKIADMSDGESGVSEDHFDFDIVYSIKDGELVQTKSENIMMDSNFDSIELIKAPLIKGNKWTQKAVDKYGNNKYLRCEIIGIDEVGGAKVYTVEYRDEESEYYEIRMIEEEVGVVSFTKLWQSENESFEIGYSLFKEMSGYQEVLK